MSDISVHFEYSPQMIKALEDTVNDYIFSESTNSSPRLHPMPSLNNYMTKVKQEFHNNNNHLVAQYGVSGGGRYIFYLFRFKNIIYDIWTSDGEFHVIK